MSTAWILDFGSGQRAAVAQRQQLHLVHAPEVQTLAFAPECARHLLQWNSHCVPVLDFGRWSQGSATEARDLLGVFAYADAHDGTQRVGALWLAAPPVRVEVDDALSCDLPPEREVWRSFSLACFRHERFGAIPIIDLGPLFDAPQEGANH